MKYNFLTKKKFLALLVIGFTNHSIAIESNNKILGSRISNQSDQSISPVIIFTRDDLIKSGHNTLQDFLRTLTVSGANNADDYNNSFANGTSALNLRGIGINSTLVLINGRRVASYAQGQNNTQSFVDLNSVSFASIERVEILPEGASAIYGADAVAGVVNIILRRDYQGAEYTVGYQTDTDGDTPQTSFNAIIGAGNDRTSFTTTFNYLKRKALFYRDRDFSASADQRTNGGIDQRSAFGYPGTTYTNSTFDFIAAPGCRADLVRSQFGGTVCTSNYNEFINFYPESERFGMSMSMNHEISDNVNLYMDTSFQRNSSINIAAPAPFIGPYGPLGNSTIDVLPGGTVGIASSLTFRGLSFFVPVTNPFNTFGDDIGILHRPADFGPRTGEIHSNSYRFITGIEGLIGESNWDYDVNIGYSRNDILVENRNSINAVSLQQLALGVLDPAGSGDTLYYNPFAANDQRVIDYARLTDENRNTSWEKTVTANFSGSLMEMPAGNLNMAVGIEYRESFLSQEADPLRNSGSLVGSAGASDTFGERDQYSVYAELAIPVLDNVDVQVAGRFEDYSDFGTTTTPKIGARWQVSDDIIIHGSWGESFRAPSLQELFNGSVSSYQQGLIDPATYPFELCENNIGIACGISIPNRLVLDGGNPFLKEEQSQSWNLGIDWRINNFNLSFNYFNYDIEEIVVKISAQQTLYTNDPNLVIRVDGPSSAIDYINNGPVNASKLEISGWDLNVKYAIEIGEGVLSLNNRTTYYDTYDYYSVVSLPPISNITLLDYVQTYDELFLNPPIDGTGSSLLGNLPEFVNNLSAQYKIGNHEFNSAIHYRNGLDVPNQNGNNINRLRSPSMTTLDINYTYHVNDDSTLQFGCINCTDKNPAFNPDPNNESGYFTSLDDPRGAVVYARLTQSF
jgi:outer membrane receptor protein involved in Fe transport